MITKYHHFFGATQIHSLTSLTFLVPLSVLNILEQIR
jgi:hypothetical protein